MSGPWRCDIFIQKASGFNLVTPDEFFSISVPERVELILQSKVRFVAADGEVVPPREALAKFQSIRKNGTAVSTGAA